jgi:hypothetical protein
VSASATKGSRTVLHIVNHLFWVVGVGGGIYRRATAPAKLGAAGQHASHGVIAEVVCTYLILDRDVAVVERPMCSGRRNVQVERPTAWFVDRRWLRHMRRLESTPRGQLQGGRVSNTMDQDGLEFIGVFDMRHLTGPRKLHVIEPR